MIRFVLLKESPVAMEKVQKGLRWKAEASQENIRRPGWVQGCDSGKSECHPDISKHNKSYDDWLDVGDSEGRRKGKGDIQV